MLHKIKFYVQKRIKVGLILRERPTETVIKPFVLKNLNWDLYYKQRPKNVYLQKWLGLTPYEMPKSV